MLQSLLEERFGLKVHRDTQTKQGFVLVVGKNGPGGTVFDAVERLGLKLEPRKVTSETVVGDQVSKMPTAN